MKRNRLIIAGLVIFALAFTGSLAAAAEKTGFVDVREIMQSSAPGKKAAEDMKKIFEKSKATIQERENELKKLKDELEKQRALLKEEIFKEKDIALQKKLRDYQLLLKDSNEELQAKDQELSQKLIPEILKIIQAIGEKEKYTLIIDIGTPSIAYYAKENDITKKVVEEFNKSYKPAAAGKK